MPLWKTALAAIFGDSTRIADDLTDDQAKQIVSVAFGLNDDDEADKPAKAGKPDNLSTIPPVEPAVNFSESDEFKALRAELDAEKAKNAANTAALETARVERVKADAAAFAGEEIRAGRALSAEHTDLLADFSEAAEADHESKNTVSFSDASGATVTGSRVEKLKARHARKPSHGLFSHASGIGELPQGSTILFNGGANADSEMDDRKKADDLHRATPEGRAYLQRRDSKNR